MSWINVVAGLYYGLAGAYLLKKWVGTEYDVARPGSGARPTVDKNDGYGLLGFTGGLIYDQKIPELNWATKVPFELHLRRREPEVELLFPQEIDFYLQIHWFDMSGASETIGRHNILFHGTPDFREVNLQQMEAENRQAGTTIVLLDGTGPTALSENVDITENDNQNNSEHLPKYFDVIEPRNMTFGPLEDIELSWTVRILPAPNSNLGEIRRWFDWKNPEKVNLGNKPRISAKDEKKMQQISYDYW